MNRNWLLSLVAAMPLVALAQSAAPPTSDEEIHQNLSAMLAAGMPKYEPPKPPPKEEPPQDLRDLDKPKNGIIRLPKFVVHAPRPPVFRETDLYTKAGLAKYAMDRYSGLGPAPLGFLNAPVAVTMLQDELRTGNLVELKQSAASMAAGGDKKESQFIQQASQDTYLRRPDWGAPTPQNPSAYGAGGQH
jgi:hypothetical protein